MSNYTYRHEDKYLLTRTEEALMIQRATAVMQRDDHAGSDGYYRIRSLYFDDNTDSCYYDTESGNDPRAKFRIRIYDRDTSYIRLEKKIKNKGMTRKVSSVITKDECEAIIDGRYSEVLEKAVDTKGELIAEMQIKGLKPVVTVTYDRYPFVYPSLDIRFTVDSNLCYESDVYSFLCENSVDIPVRTSGERIMELKWNSVMPRHLVDFFRIETLQKDRFSKYYTCRSAAMMSR